MRFLKPEEAFVFPQKIKNREETSHVFAGRRGNGGSCKPPFKDSDKEEV